MQDSALRVDPETIGDRIRFCMLYRRACGGNHVVRLLGGKGELWDGMSLHLQIC